jgi:hypothetical protein
MGMGKGGKQKDRRREVGIGDNRMGQHYIFTKEKYRMAWEIKRKNKK